MYFTAVLVFTAYSAVIISHLAFMKPTLPFHSFQGLLDDTSYDLGILDEPTMFITFEVRKFKHCLFSSTFKIKYIYFSKELTRFRLSFALLFV
jgi:hypothetical protein